MRPRAGRELEQRGWAAATALTLVLFGQCEAAAASRDYGEPGWEPELVQLEGPILL